MQSQKTVHVSSGLELVEYSIFTKGLNPLKECPVYDTKPFDEESSVPETWGM